MIPDEKNAVEIFRTIYPGVEVAAKRFKTGNQNYVYDISTPSRNYVLRLTVAAHAASFEAALYWNAKLRALGVPLPEIYHADITGKFPYLLMQRFPGVDLGKAYGLLSTADKRNIAEKIRRIHDKVGMLPNGRGYGYAKSHDGPFPYNNWRDVVEAAIRKATPSLAGHGLFKKNIVPMEAAFSKIAPVLAEISPHPFLHDTTTKNVIINERQFSGIVDVDDLCFGDPLYVLALTYCGLAVEGHDTAYADFWKEKSALGAQAEICLAFYRAQHAYYFMHEAVAGYANGLESATSVDRLQLMFDTALDDFHVEINKWLTG